MTGIDWSPVEAAAQLLGPDEREAVLGDLVEAGAGAWQGLLDVLGLVIRRESALWKSWRPWLAAFGLAMPSSFLLMGASVSVSQTLQRPHGGLLLPMCQMLLLIAWSWTGGFVVGSLSRRTLWVSAALSLLPCLFCLARFRVESLARPCLLVFLPPAIWGVMRGLEIARLKLGSAIVVATGATGLTILTSSGRGPGVLHWALLWPAWYIVAMAWKPGRRAERR